MDSLQQLLTSVFVVTLLLVLGLLLSALGNILGNAWQERRRVAVKARWEPILFAAMDGEGLALPTLPQRDRERLLRLWSRTRSYVDGAAVDRLRALANDLQLGEHAAQLLRGRQLADQILGAEILGELRDARHWDALQRQLDHPHPSVALAVIEAMVHIDPSRAASRVVHTLLGRPHWDPVRVKRLMQTLGQNAGQPMLQSLKPIPAGGAARLIHWMGQSGWIGVLPALRERLATDPPVEECVAILEAMALIGGAQEREHALRYLAHKDWRVRMYAVRALGKLGLTNDRDAIAERLTDPVWWVRYRAAGALNQLRGVPPAYLDGLAQTHPDRYARDAIRRVLAEPQIE